MKNYKIDEPAAISFSGGRTSAFMLYKILDEYDGILPDHLKVTFANTGKEMPETLDFVRDCGEKWDVEIIWLECNARKGGENENKHVYETIIVDYESASRNGEPFESLINARNYLPNVVARFCTQELKVLRIRDYMQRFYDPGEWVNIIGIRADEERRAHKIFDRSDDLLPLFYEGITKEDIFNFWENNSFDLNLPNQNGVTDWGNCDLFYLKGSSIKSSIIRERPDLAIWWADIEDKQGAYFRNDQPSYRQMLNQPSFNFGTDETIPCFCGD